MRLTLAVLAIVGLGGLAAAQHHHQPAHAPYAGMNQRGVKALSEQQVVDLRAGRGMGLALAAELNGYPGPMHAIELADKLGLDAPTRRHLQRLFEDMKAEAIPAGELLITRETALDRAFADRTISAEALNTLTALIGESQGQLRAIHLKYHLITADLMTSQQRLHYAQLRGYR